MASRIEPSPRTPEVLGQARPAWRMNHRGPTLRWQAAGGAARNGATAAQARRRTLSVRGNRSLWPRFYRTDRAPPLVRPRPIGFRRTARRRRSSTQNSPPNRPTSITPTSAWSAPGSRRGGCGPNEADLGGTFKARFERDAFDEALQQAPEPARSRQRALVFGRIDRYAESSQTTESFHIGAWPWPTTTRSPGRRLAGAVAEPFYRATGREPMGLVRRRHFVVEGRPAGHRGRAVRGGYLGVGHDEGLVDSEETEPAEDDVRPTLRILDAAGWSVVTGTWATSSPPSRSSRTRSSAPPGRRLVVQGGPGTGKTVVALHRAAYLLYTYRFPWQDQGVLVMGRTECSSDTSSGSAVPRRGAGVEQVVQPVSFRACSGRCT